MLFSRKYSEWKSHINFQHFTFLAWKDTCAEFESCWFSASGVEIDLSTFCVFIFTTAMLFESPRMCLSYCES
jgi:hypothetical protein